MGSIFPLHDFIIWCSQKILLFAFLGLIVGLGVGAASVSLWPFLCLFLFFYLLKETDDELKYCALAFAFHLNVLLTSHYWIINSVFSVIDNEIVAFFIGCLLLLIFSFTLSFLLVLFLYPLLLLSERRALWPLFFSFSWIFGEFIRSLFSFSFPFSYVGYLVFENSYVMQAAEYISVYGVGAFILLTFMLLAMGWRGIIVSVSIWAVGMIFGAYTLNQEYLSKDTLYARIVNANVAQGRLDDYSSYKGILDEHKQLSMDGSIRRDKDLIIWPESILRFGIESEVVEYVSSFLGDDEQLIAGGFSPFGDEGGVYNSLFLMSAKNGVVSTYNKLLPLLVGEYLPYRGLLPDFANKHLGRNNIAVGSEVKNIVVSRGINIYPLLCSEAHYPQLLIPELNNADLILILANEAWVIGSSEIYNLLKAAKFRSIEARKTVVLVSNGGFLAVVDPFGAVVSSKYEKGPSFLDVDIKIF